MTKFAPVAPLHGLIELAKAKLLGDYQLLIAPKILGNDWGYGRFFHEHPGQFVIVDNGVIELGYSLRAIELYSAAKIVNANVVIMPDTIDDGKMTIKQVRRALGEFQDLDADRRFATMGVVQGATFEECLVCAASLIELGVNWLAVPRGLTKNLGSRVPLVQALAAVHRRSMHILGFSDYIADDIAAATASDLVVGIDAATPVWTNEWLPPQPPLDRAGSLALGSRPGDFWQTPISDRAGRNVETVRRWLSAAQAARTEEAEPAAQADH